MVEIKTTVLLRIHKLIPSTEDRVNLRFILEKTVRFHKDKHLMPRQIRKERLRKIKVRPCRARELSVQILVILERRIMRSMLKARWKWMIIHLLTIFPKILVKI